MILSATRIKTASGGGAIVVHVWHGAENECVTVLRGTKADIDDMVADARRHGATYAVRHYSINPSAATTREQALGAVRVLAVEFDFDPASAVVIEHRKRRRGGAASPIHWHALIPEVDVGRGRVLDSHHIRQRNEKLARALEAEAGEAFTKGRHNRAVAAQLDREGRTELATAIREAGLCDGAPANAAFTSDQHQTTKRKGLNLPALKAAVVDAWAASDGATFRAALTGHGLSVAIGDKRGVWVIRTTAGDMVGALHRLVRAKVGAVDRRMSATPPAEVPPATEDPDARTIRQPTTMPSKFHDQREEFHDTSPTTSADATPSTFDRADDIGPFKSATVANFPAADADARARDPRPDGRPEDRHRPDHRPADPDRGRRAVAGRADRRTAHAGGGRSTAGMATAGRHIGQCRRLEKQLAPHRATVANLIGRQAQPVTPGDPAAYLATLRRQIDDLRRKAAQPAPVFSHIVRADPARAAAMARMQAADDRLEAVGYDMPPRWTVVPYLIWRYRRNTAEREVALAHQAFDVADDAVSAKAVAIIEAHAAAAAQAAAEAERLEVVADALRAGGARVRAAVRCRCNFKTIETAATRDNANRRATEAAAMAAMEIKMLVRRAMAPMPEANPIVDEPTPTFKPPWG